MSKANPFTVSALTPRGPNGSAPTGQLAYELTRASVHPTRIVGRNRLGRPIEETVNIVYSTRWLHPSGTIHNVPMRTGAVFSMDANAVAYEQETSAELLNEGWIPVGSCPYTTEFRRLTGTPWLVDNSEGIADCGGDAANDGCVHLKELARQRTHAFNEEARLSEEAASKMSKAQASELLARMGAAFEVARETATREEDEDEATKPARPSARGK